MSVHQLPVLESEQNWVVWARYVGTVSLGPHIRWRGGVLQCGGPESSLRIIPGYYVPGCLLRHNCEILLNEIPKTVDGPLNTLSAEKKLISKSPFYFKHVTI